MRCEKCGRDMKNAELWQLATDPKAPTSWSMQQLCWDCRQHPEREAQPETRNEARHTEADGTATPGSLPLEELDFQGFDSSLYN
jgi:hypothetical protein